ncbi:MAG: sugar phosphate isomerase/epimerase [Chitinivibrionia bacterium]|nr:sugar phosphate isomerase/epimerase [Chitinivibrionia bacterium]
MKLAFSTNAFTRFDLAAAVNRIADAGYEGVEILADSPHAFLDEGWRDTAGLETVLRRRGLSVSNINANTARGFYLPGRGEDPFEPSLSNPDGTLRRWRVVYTRRCVDLAAALGCRSVSVTSGSFPPGMAVPEERERRMALLAESLEELLGYAQGRGVSLGVEYEPGLLIGAAEAVLTLFERVDSPALGVNLDVGHAVVAGEDLPSVISRLGPRILNLHIEDIRGRIHEHLIPGLGEIDFDDLLASLKKIDYQSYLTVELYPYVEAPDEAARSAFAFLSRKIQSQKGVSS